MNFIKRKQNCCHIRNTCDMVQIIDMAMQSTYIHICVKIEVSLTNILGFININVTKREQRRLQMKNMYVSGCFSFCLIISN